jgi:hypothetical protein
MNWIRRHRPAPGTAFGFAALLVALGGVAFAAIPDSNGSIHGCYQKNGGTLRVVESASDCRNSEQAITWSQGPSFESEVAYARVGHCDSCDPATGTGSPPFSHSKNVIGVLRVQGNSAGWFGRTVDCWDLTAPASNAQMTSGSVIRGVDVPPDLIPACPAPFNDAMTDGVSSYFALFQLSNEP